MLLSSSSLAIPRKRFSLLRKKNAQQSYSSQGGLESVQYPRPLHDRGRKRKQLAFILSSIENFSWSASTRRLGKSRAACQMCTAFFERIRCVGRSSETNSASLYSTFITINHSSRSSMRTVPLYKKAASLLSNDFVGFGSDTTYAPFLLKLAMFSRTFAT